MLAENLLLGKLFFANGQLSYEGQYLNGAYEGKGKQWLDNGHLWYIGNFKNARTHGQGINWFMSY